MKNTVAISDGKRKNILNGLYIFTKKVEDCDRGISKMETPSGKQNMTIINESGLYVLIFGICSLEMVRRYLEDIGFATSGKRPEFIPENVFYRLAMKAKNETAVKFQAKVADEIIPSIRKTGGYVDDDNSFIEKNWITYKRRQINEQYKL